MRSLKLKAANGLGYDYPAKDGVCGFQPVLNLRDSMVDNTGMFSYQMANTKMYETLNN